MSSSSVHVADCDGLIIPFARRADAEAVAAQWNIDHAGAPSDGRRRGARVVEVDAWHGEGAVWDCLPGYGLMWAATVSYLPDGECVREWPVSGRWAWEFEENDYTTADAEWVTLYRPGPDAVTDAHARGSDRGAVAEAYTIARAEALRLCGGHPGAKAP